MNGSATTRWSLPWPVVPPRLWATAGATAVAIASLAFNQEIWPHHPQARQWSWIALAVLLQAGALQLIIVLWAWPSVLAGPAWLRLLLRVMVLALIAGIAIGQLWTLVICCFFAANS